MRYWTALTLSEDTHIAFCPSFLTFLRDLSRPVISLQVEVETQYIVGRGMLGVTALGRRTVNRACEISQWSVYSIALLGLATINSCRELLFCAAALASMYVL